MRMGHAHLPPGGNGITGTAFGNGITKSAEAWAMAQWADYQMKRNVFASSNKAMWDDARSTSPHDWWFTWASRAPELQYVCMRMHSVAMSTGAGQY